MRRQRTHCHHGHKYTEATTRWRTNTGSYGVTTRYRRCATCCAVTEGNRKARLRVAAGRTTTDASALEAHRIREIIRLDELLNRVPIRWKADEIRLQLAALQPGKVICVAEEAKQ